MGCKGVVGLVGVEADAAQRLLHQLPQGPGYLLLFLVLLLLLLLLLCAAILWLLLLLHYRFE